MPQPTWTLNTWQWSQKGFLKFGGRPLPLVGTTMAYVDLNDAVQWFAENITVDHKKILGVKPLIYSGESVTVSRDWGTRIIKVKERYDESSGIPFAQAKALLSQGGEQYLTTDNLTAIICELMTIGTPSLITGSVSPYMFATELEFQAVAPWAIDMAATTVGAFAVAGSSGAGTTTGFNTTYAGSVHSKPIFTFTIPVGNTATISQIKLQNTLTQQILTVNFSPVLPASTARVITIDTNQWLIFDGGGVYYDPIGTFPVLAPPAGTVNTWQFTVVSNIGTTGLTIGYSYNNRWEF